MSKDIERDDCGFNVDLAKLPLESDALAKSRRNASQRVAVEFTAGFNKTLAHMVPMLSRKYHMPEAAVRYLLALLMRQISVPLELGSLLTGEEEFECVLRMSEVVNDVAKKHSPPQ